ncbi:MAG: hypothetical protein Q9185_006388 [Variospora sp. 1 TL-2023]
MSDEGANTLSAFPSSINSPSPVSVSAITDTPYPTGLVIDTSIPSAPSITIPDTLFTTTDDPLTSLTAFSSTASSTLTIQNSASPTAAAVTASQPTLTKPQVAGVAVGSIAAAGLVFGLLALFFFLRDRKKKRRASDASFGNDKIMIDQPRTPSPHPPPGPITQDMECRPRDVETAGPSRTEATIARPPSERWSFWRKSVKPEEIGVAVARNPVAQTTYDRSPVTPMSAASYETTSRLLPDKPTYSLFPPPLRLSPYNQDVNPIEASGPIVAGFGRALPGLVPKPAPRGRGTMDTSQMYMHLGLPALRAVPSDPFLDSSSSGRQTDPRQFQTLPAQRTRAAPSKPASVHYGQWTKPVEVHRKPVPARLTPNNLRSDPSIERLDWGLDAPLQATVAPADLSFLTVEPQSTRRKSSGKRRLSGKRPPTFLSAASDTSFEDADSDTDPPPLPQNTLSPVVESPRSRRRTAGVRYPVIPTSAAESPSIDRTVRQIRREQIELNPASDRSKGKTKVSPKASPQPPSFLDKPMPNVPNVPELAGTELKERQQVPDNGSDRVKPGSAKWNILVAPGLEGIENVGSPKSKTSMEWTPVSTPTRVRR